MNANRMKTLILAGCQIVLLCGIMPRPVSAAAASAGGTEQAYPVQLAQQQFTSSKWPGEYAAQSGDQGMTGPAMGPGTQGMMGPGGRGMMGPGMRPGMGPGSQGMMGPGTGPGSQGMMGPGTGPGSQGMMGPGMAPGSQGMMGPGKGPGSQGMMGPGMGPGGQGMMGPGMAPGGQGMMGPGMAPGGQGMMGGPMSGSPMGMLGAIGALDLNEDQRSQYDAINQDLKARMQEITERMNAASKKLRTLQEEQLRTGKTLNDLRGHMLQATMDAANRAEELLTDEQRQSVIDQGRHIMMQPRSLPYAGSQGGNTE